MSDLAPFVAAAIRDHVVMNQQEEILSLQAQLEQERRQSKTVSITGPRGFPIYAQAQFDDGNFDYSPELWKVEFQSSTSSSSSSSSSNKPKKMNVQVQTTTTTTTSQRQRHSHSPTQTLHSSSSCCCCSLAELGDMEVRIGGICKARFTAPSGATGGNIIVEGFVNDIHNNYNPIDKTGTVSIWFGGSSGIWLNIRIGPIERDQYASLRDFDLGGENLLHTLYQFYNTTTSIVIFEEVSFLISYMNGAMIHWGISPEPPPPKPPSTSTPGGGGPKPPTTTTTTTTAIEI